MTGAISSIAIIICMILEYFMTGAHEFAFTILIWQGSAEYCMITSN